MIMVAATWITVVLRLGFRRKEAADAQHGSRHALRGVLGGEERHVARRRRHLERLTHHEGLGAPSIRASQLKSASVFSISSISIYCNIII